MCDGALQRRQSRVGTHSLLSSSISSFFWQPVAGSAMLSCIRTDAHCQQAALYALRLPLLAAGHAAGCKRTIQNPCSSKSFQQRPTHLHAGQPLRSPPPLPTPQQRRRARLKEVAARRLQRCKSEAAREDGQHSFPVKVQTLSSQKLAGVAPGYAMTWHARIFAAHGLALLHLAAHSTTLYLTCREAIKC